MQIETSVWSKKEGWKLLSKKLKKNADLVLCFGERNLLEKAGTYKDIKKRFTSGELIVASSAGEIANEQVYDDSLVCSAISFADTKVKTASLKVKKGESGSVGKELAKSLPADGLAHCLVFSDGLVVNGTELVDGLIEVLPETVSVTGGLVGDNARFEKTVVGLNEKPISGNVVLVGLYSDSLKVSYGSLGGWDDFGPSRKITKSKENVLFELDDKPALELYKKYLGEKAKDLPASGLLFPLSLETNDGKEIVRTLLSVDEKEQSMTFAGSMPEGVRVKLMKANFDRLIDGAAGAASLNVEKIKQNESQFALLISCIGRKLVLGSRIEEEIEAVQEVLGKDVPMLGFYSYGEIAPTAPTERQCRLHNQTMTITTFSE